MDTETDIKTEMDMETETLDLYNWQKVVEIIHKTLWEGRMVEENI